MRDPDKLIKALALEAGVAIQKKFGQVGVKYTKKNPADVVTEADLAANKIIIKGIRKAYPDHDILSEELPWPTRKSPYLWIIDPLDGTRNFASGTPFFCTMIGLAKDDEMQLAAIYDPTHDDLYFARKGGGAFLNGKKIICSRTKEWKYSFGCGTSEMDIHSNDSRKKLIAIAQKEPFWMGALGSIGLSMVYVAAGKRDWAYCWGGEIWDYAPTLLILEEAGCIVTDLNGKPWNLESKSMVVGNKYLQSKLLDIISSENKKDAFRVASYSKKDKISFSEKAI
jgi:myo-inositol-1(or 4)-monophosphatase